MELGEERVGLAQPRLRLFDTDEPDGFGRADLVEPLVEEAGEGFEVAIGHALTLAASAAVVAARFLRHTVSVPAVARSRPSTAEPLLPRAAEAVTEGV